jgi:ATP-dependent Clp protease ATP-binding subunit ClpA
MYERITGPDSREQRRPRFTYDTDFKDIERTVREAIRDEFTTELGRPEWLGRIRGAESIIVFDYLRDLERVCRKFVANIAAACRRLRAIELIVDDEVISRVVDAVRASPDSLVLGGRGLSPKLEGLLTDPLSDYLFAHPETQGRLRCTLQDGQTVFLPNAP